MVRLAQGIEELMMMTPFFDTTLVFYVHLTPSILHITSELFTYPLLPRGSHPHTLCSIIQFSSSIRSVISRTLFLIYSIEPGNISRTKKKSSRSRSSCRTSIFSCSDVTFCSVIRIVHGASFCVLAFTQLAMTSHSQVVRPEIRYKSL